MKATQSARKHPRLRNSKWPRVVTAGSVKVKMYRISPKEGTPFYQIADYSLGQRRLRSVASETSGLDQARQLAAKMARMSGRQTDKNRREVEVMRGQKREC
jgi:hypothetical protein